MAALVPAVVLVPAHKVLEGLLVLLPLRTLPADAVAIAHKYNPYAETDQIQQPRMFRAQRGFKAGAGDKAAKQEKNSDLHI